MERRRLRHSPALRHRQPAHPGAGLRHHFSGGTAHPRIARRVRGLCLMWGTANFIITFKAAAIVPADLFARPAPPPRGRRLQPVFSPVASCSAGRCSPPIASPWRSCAPTKARSLGRVAANVLAAACWCASAPQYRGHRHQERLRRNRGRMGCARLLCHPGHRALLPPCAQEPHAQASGGLLRRGRGRHPGPFAEDPLTERTARWQSPPARHNGQPTQRRPPLAMQHRNSPKHSPTTDPTSSPS